MTRHRAIVFDLDGTLTPVRSIWQHLHEALGLWDGEALLHQRAFEAGKIGYREWCALDASHWRGMQVSELRAIADAIPYSDGVRKSVSALRGRGMLIGVLTTGLDLLAERVRDELRFDYAAYNCLEAEGGVLTGGVIINVEHDRKDAALDRFCTRFGLAPQEVIAVGDSDGDIPMFRMAGYSVAVRCATPGAVEAASVVLRDDSLDGLLSLLPAPAANGHRTPIRFND